MGQMFFGDTNTGILDGDIDPFVLFLVHRNDQVSPSRHGLDRIDDQVQQDLLQLLAVAAHLGQPWGDVLVYLDFAQGDLVAGDLDGSIHPADRVSAVG